jgi:mono/diheme cytochrome c family protein
MFVRTRLLASVLFAVTLGWAHAQDVDAGRVIAERWCSSCHLVDHTQNEAPNDAIPSFRAIANMKSTTMTSLAVFLQTPHEPMPNFMLSRRQIADVSAYVLSLRAAETTSH